MLNPLLISPPLTRLRQGYCGRGEWGDIALMSDQSLALFLFQGEG
jgi:hypothetical protein